MSPREIFVRPEALPLLLLAPLVWFALRALERARARRLAQLAGPRLSALTSGPLARRAVPRSAVAGAGLLLALVAMLEPVWGEGERTVEQRGVDVLVCLDVSRSMLARDQPPSRLLAARREIRAFAERARGDRVGLVVFAGEARLVVPLTRDMDSLAELVETADPLSVRRGGTDLGAALSAALGALGGGHGGHEAVLLLTDGEDHEGRGLRAADEARRRGIPVHCVLFGSALGAKIAIAGEGGETFLCDRSGGEVVTSADSASLRRIAEATGGVFVDAGSVREPLAGLYDERVAPMARKSFDADRRRERVNRFQWPLLAAFALWTLDLWLTGRGLR